MFSIGNASRPAPPSPSITIRPQSLSRSPLRGKLKNVENADPSESHKPALGQAEAANLIKDFLRRAVAAQSYGCMFSNGSIFDKAGLALSKSSKKRFSFEALNHLEKLSKKHLAAVTVRVGELSHDEKKLLNNILSSEWCFRHQSNAALDRDGSLKIFSDRMLDAEHISHMTATNDADREIISNHDFVFFGVEFSGGYTKGYIPLNTQHGMGYRDYGGNAFVISENNSLCGNGYLTLTDHFNNSVPFPSAGEHKIFANRFPEASEQACREIAEVEGNSEIVPIFSVSDMKSALALHLIEFLRKSEDEGFREFVFNDLQSTGLNLDRVLNMIFQAEFHIPRMFGGDDYSKYVVHPINLSEAINVSNFEVLSESITNRDLASEAMYFAIKASKNEIVSYLFENENFNASCFLASMEQGGGVFGRGELAYILSGAGACPLILEQFLERELIDPHATFEKYQRRENMMDNAIHFANFPESQESSKRLVDVLQKYGAKPSRFRPPLAL